ncbi:hypothetical protein H8D83_01295 [Candidatus Woesearchaeota archaeon]|nr:hypothetical protein [Candidatus Woesearchaeota archaeon]
MANWKVVDFSCKVRKSKEKLGLKTDLELSQKLEVCHSLIGKWLDNKTKRVKDTTVGKFAELLEVSTEDFQYLPCNQLFNYKRIKNISSFCFNSFNLSREDTVNLFTRYAGYHILYRYISDGRKIILWEIINVHSYDEDNNLIRIKKESHYNFEGYLFQARENCIHLFYEETGRFENVSMAILCNDINSNNGKFLYGVLTALSKHDFPFASACVLEKCSSIEEVNSRLKIDYQKQSALHGIEEYDFINRGEVNKQILKALKCNKNTERFIKSERSNKYFTDLNSKSCKR